MDNGTMLGGKMLDVYYFCIIIYLHYYFFQVPSEEVLEAYVFSLVLCCSLTLFLCFVTFMIMSDGQWHNANCNNQILISASSHPHIVAQLCDW